LLWSIVTTIFGGDVMLAKKPLTDRGIAALKPPRQLVWDAVVPGFAVRVTDNGAKAFVLVTRYPGSSNPTARSLGKVGAITLEDARVRAREWLKQVAAGVDPALAMAAAETAQRDTLGAICAEYLARDGGKLRSVGFIRSTLERLVLPTLGPRPIAEVRRSDVIRLLDAIEDGRGPVMANRTLAILGRVLNWYAGRSDDYASPIVRGMARRKEVARDRVLTDDELRVVWSAPASPEPVFSAFVRFLLLTAARRNEVAEMKWTELADGQWTLPAGRNKTGVELVRPLSAAALGLLAELPRLGEWTFTRTGNAPLSGLARFKIELDRVSGTQGWTYHDLRRTSRSLMSRAAVPSDVAERCLGHVLPGMRKVYDRHAYREEMLRAFEALASLIARIVDPQPNIVPMRGER
jgi:integrase